MNKNLNEQINWLDYKYQFVKRNKHWDHDQSYELKSNNNKIRLLENDILLKISLDIVTNICHEQIGINNFADYEIPNINIEQMKKIVISFFTDINPKLTDKITYIFTRTTFNKYDDTKPNDNQRSFINKDRINFYYKSDLKSLISLAHEISHAVAATDDYGNICNNNKVDLFNEVESLLTEQLFLEYLRKNNLQVKEKSIKSDIHFLDKNDINNIKYNKLKNIIFLSYRAIDELEFKKLMKNRKVKKIDSKLINDIAQKTKLKPEIIILRINKFIDEYYPSDSLTHNFLEDNYDLKNGRHLSNESRFIYGWCLVEKFNNMNLSDEQKIDFYRKYLANAKYLSFQNILELFNVNILDLSDFSYEFINSFNSLTRQADFNITEKR